MFTRTALRNGSALKSALVSTLLYSRFICKVNTVPVEYFHLFFFLLNLLPSFHNFFLFPYNLPYNLYLYCNKKILLSLVSIFVLLFLPLLFLSIFAFSLFFLSCLSPHLFVLYIFIFSYFPPLTWCAFHIFSPPLCLAFSFSPYMPFLHLLFLMFFISLCPYSSVRNTAVMIILSQLISVVALQARPWKSSLPVSCAKRSFT